MSGGRAKVLGDVRRSLGRGELDAAAKAALVARSAEPPRGVQATFSGDPLEHFLAKLSSPTLTASAEALGGFADIPKAVGDYLARHDLPRHIALVAAAELANLAWGDIEHPFAIDPNEAVSVTLANFAIAETGTLVFHSSPETPTLFNFLPHHHLAVLEERHLLRHLEDYWDWRRRHPSPWPRNINFITGTSGTADIEAKLVRGAHGPRALHVLLIRSP